MPITALIVDDSPDNRYIFRNILEEQAVEVEEAENGLIAMDLLDERSFDLLLLDLNMPHMDGESVLEDVRRDPTHDSMTVIVLTAEPHRSTQQVENLASFTMTKPVDVELFSRFIKRILANQTP